MKKTHNGIIYELVDQDNTIALCCDGCDVNNKGICRLFPECLDNLDQVWKIAEEITIEN